jgi:hypothetical protein
MRIIFAYTVLLVFILPGMMKFGTFVRWKMDQDWIVRTQCVNVNKPERKCGGKCRLSLLLRQYDQTHTPIGNPRQEEQRIELSWFEIPDDFSLFFIRPLKAKKLIQPTTPNWVHHPYKQCVFRPPDDLKNA